MNTLVFIRNIVINNKECHSDFHSVVQVESRNRKVIVLKRNPLNFAFAGSSSFRQIMFDRWPLSLD